MENNQWSRRPIKQEVWQGHISTWTQSGQSQREYCRHQSLALSSFSYWRRKINQDKDERPRFYPLTVTPVVAGENSIAAGLNLFIQKERSRLGIKADFSAALLKKAIATLE